MIVIVIAFFYGLQIYDGVEQNVLFQIEQYVHKEGTLAGNQEQQEILLGTALPFH